MVGAICDDDGVESTAILEGSRKRAMEGSKERPSLDVLVLISHVLGSKLPHPAQLRSPGAAHVPAWSVIVPNAGISAASTRRRQFESL